MLSVHLACVYVYVGSEVCESCYFMWINKLKNELKLSDSCKELGSVVFYSYLISFIFTRSRKKISTQCKERFRIIVHRPSLLAAAQTPLFSVKSVLFGNSFTCNTAQYCRWSKLFRILRATLYSDSALGLQYAQFTDRWSIQLEAVKDWSHQGFSSGPLWGVCSYQINHTICIS